MKQPVLPLLKKRKSISVCGHCCESLGKNNLLPACGFARTRRGETLVPGGHARSASSWRIGLPGTKAWGLSVFSLSTLGFESQ